MREHVGRLLVIPITQTGKAEALQERERETMLNTKQTQNKHTKRSNRMGNNTSVWGRILNVVITVLTALATAFGVQSCTGL